MLAEAEDDVLCHMDFPSVHWRQIRSANGLERLNCEVAGRFDVVGIFPNRDAAIRPGGTILAEQDGEWLTSRRCFSEQSMAAVNEPVALPDPGTVLLDKEVAPLAKSA
jgi:putative transposase